MNTRRLTLDIPKEIFADLERIASAATDKAQRHMSPFGVAEVLLVKAVHDFIRERETDGEPVSADQATEGNQPRPVAG